MNNEVELEGRPRPLSAGLWTLFSWLRRDDRSDSTESLSSAGSDRTVASFAFLAPAHYQTATAPLVIPPPGPPTDSYKKRVHERNFRCQYDRDITLHRKYGLFKSCENSSYDAFSLPPVRRLGGESCSRWERERRATSECFHRRLAHVPGKRRAPLPPVSAIPTAPPAPLIRGNPRKRRAPQPPVTSAEQNKENINRIEVHTNSNIQMNTKKNKTDNYAHGHKFEKYSKKEERPKDSKTKCEKNFLKQIFDSKKRSSGIDITCVKLLPSISELDKQAAEIIETSKLNAKEQKGDHNTNVILEEIEYQRAQPSDNWICVTCLRKHSSSLTTCLYCLPKQKTILPNSYNNDINLTSKASDNYTQTEKSLAQCMSSNKNAAEEKQKLKEMLKEMKDSLPKRATHDFNVRKSIKVVDMPSAKQTHSYSTETPTLRVGSTIQKDNILSSTTNKTSMCNIKAPLEEIVTSSQSSVIVKSPEPLTSTLSKKSNIDMEKDNPNIKNNANLNAVSNIKSLKQTKSINVENSQQFINKRDLYIPLKISSLLNPVYVPKNSISNQSQTTNASQHDFQTEKQIIVGEKFSNTKRTTLTAVNVTQSTPLNEVLPGTSTSHVNRLTISVNKSEVKSKIEIPKSTAGQLSTSKQNAISVVLKNDDNNNKNLRPSSSLRDQCIQQDQYSKRRNLIRQLEQSIAKGDETAAAEAAAKLAQLRLSCSVLSFSSQILSQPSTSAANTTIENNKIKKLSTENYLSVAHLKNHDRAQLSPIKEISSQSDEIPQVFNTTSSTPKISNDTVSAARTNVISLKAVQSNHISPIQEPTNGVKKEEPSKKYEMITIAVLVEDREATRGPVHLLISRHALMRDLRREAEASLGVATNLQRWIVGRVLCVNDDIPVATLAGPNFSAPFYLCVVESEIKTELTTLQIKIAEKPDNVKNNSNTKNVYTELVELEQQALVPNAETFECGICMEEYTPGHGIVLRECVHIFCKDCMSDVVRHCEEPDVPCPAMGCRGILQEREIRALVSPQDYERWLARGLATAESGIRNAFHCRTRDCQGWALCEPGVQRFPCPVCKRINCVLCQAIHDGETCEQHREKLKQEAAGKSHNDDGTRTLLKSMIAKGEALECPECSAIITKKWGCDWVKCSACKTEICWVTRGRRWGPSGKGDTSGGCRCGVDGRRCHLSCNYCH